ncbi:type VI secretion system ATPase TssH [Aromatoleum sp.]|uniref:type VI secretion system ATPase TssH n=1 Tax=Aromatoleum sp. TaxID=2307007 RepID=UPI002FC7760D
MQSLLKALFARLTPAARAAFEDAVARTVSRTNHEVEIEHVLLALIGTDTNALAAALRTVGIGRADVERELNGSADRFRSGNTRHPLLSAGLITWLERAWLLAGAERGEERVSSLDLLLALLVDDRLRSGIAQTAPTLAAIEPARLADAYATLRRHGGEDGVESRPEAAGGTRLLPSADSRGTTAAMGGYTVDLTALAEAGKIDPVIGREAEIRQLVDILLRRRQNNPILTGEPGVGKTAVVEGLALRIVRGEVPPALAGIRLRTLDLGLLQAGASVKGEFENRLRQVIDEVKASAVPIVLFIDEAHTLIGAGGQAGQNDAANLLKPALARGELRTIAATTWSEYKKYFEKDAALARRFQVVKVEEPDTETAVHMVRGIAQAMSAHHGVSIREEAIRAAVDLSSRYLAGRQLPDKAIGVLDTACARVALSRAGRPGPVEDIYTLVANIDRELAALRDEDGAAARIAELERRRTVLEGDLGRLHEEWAAQRDVVDEIDALNGKGRNRTSPARDELAGRRAALRELHRAMPLAFECVDANVIADVVSAWTGIPLGRMIGDELGRVRSLAAILAQRVVGQDAALAQIAERVQIAKAGLEDPIKPKGVFLLVGPSGVGKTETALALADALYGGERNLVTINMSEYQEAHSISGLKGSPPGYVGYGEGGVLTEAVRRRPYSVVLLDEVEKAHPDVLELFFQVFDKGVLEDGEGRAVDFRNTLILLTSNAGADLVMRAVEDGVTTATDEAPRVPTPQELVELLRPTLQKVFKPAFLGRLVIVPYFPIGPDVLERIVALKLRRIGERITARHGARVDFAPTLAELVAQRCDDVGSGARDADAVLARTVLAGISSQLLDRMAKGKPVKRVAVSASDGMTRVKIN